MTIARILTHTFSLIVVGVGISAMLTGEIFGVVYGILMLIGAIGIWQLACEI